MDIDLLRQAMTHSSARTAVHSDNERLEFLGDRILGIAIAEALLNADKTASEGVLAPRLNSLVRKETLAEIAEKIQLGKFLLLGRSERYSQRRSKYALLADALEAVIAAIYLDGGYEKATHFINHFWKQHIADVAVDARDSKTILQERMQAQGDSIPHYELIANEGPSHMPSFTVEVHLKNGVTARGKAGSKREAEQIAAQNLLQKIEENER